jgi:LacI family transcriptional regulator
MKTLKEIAEELGVSVSAVSYVYNGKWGKKRISKKLARKIEKKLKEENYEPNFLGLQLKTKKTYTIGVILGDLTRKYNLEILSGIEKILARKNYLSLISNSNLGEREIEALKILIRRNVDGIIIGPNTNDPKVKELIKETEIPIVFVDNYLPELNIDFVVSDNFFGAYKAVNYLIKNGCKRIMYLGSSKRLEALKERFNGYINAIKENQIEVEEKLIINRFDTIDYEELKKIIEGIKPDGIFLESFIYSNKLFKFLFEKKMIIPDDIKIIGFDPVDLNFPEIQKNHFHSIIKKPIPYVEQKAQKMGEIAGEILLYKIEGKNKKIRKIFLKPDLNFMEV